MNQYGMPTPVTPYEEPKKKSNTVLIVILVVLVLLCCCCVVGPGLVWFTWTYGDQIFGITHQLTALFI